MESLGIDTSSSCCHFCHLPTRIDCAQPTHPKTPSFSTENNTLHEELEDWILPHLHAFQKSSHPFPPLFHTHHPYLYYHRFQRLQYVYGAYARRQQLRHQGVESRPSQWFERLAGVRYVRTQSGHLFAHQNIDRCQQRRILHLGLRSGGSGRPRSGKALEGRLKEDSLRKLLIGNFIYSLLIYSSSKSLRQRYSDQLLDYLY